MLLVGSFGVISLLNYAFAVALAWLMPPAEYGLVGILQAILLLSAMTLNSGFPWTLARTMSRTEQVGLAWAARVFRTSLTGNLVLGVALGASLLGLHAAGVFGLSERMTPVIVIAAATLPLFALNSVARGALHGATRFGRLSLIRAGEVAVKVAVGLALVAFVLTGVEGVAVAFLLGATVAATLAFWCLRDLLPGIGPLAPLGVYRATLPMFVGSLGMALVITIDLLVLKAIGPTGTAAAAAVGWYIVASMLARLPYFVGDAVMDSVFPFMARRADSPARSHGHFSPALRWIALVVLPAELVLVLRPEPVLELFFPAAYLGAVPIVRILAIGSLGVLGLTLFGKALQAVGRPGLAATGVTLAVIVECVLLAALVPARGAEGAAIAFAIGTWSGAALLVTAYFRHQGAPLPRPGFVARQVLAVAAAGAVLLVPVDGTIHGLASVAGAALAYGAAALVLGLVRPAELMRGPTPPGEVDLDVPAPRPEFEPSPVASRVIDWVAARPVVAIATMAAVGLLLALTNLGRAPDSMFDEAVYSQAARNILVHGDLTWRGDPVFVHPPLFFVATAAWLGAAGADVGDFFTTAHAARVLVAAFAAVNVGLAMHLVHTLAATVSARRTLVLAASVGVLVALDPVLLRYGRVAMIDTVALTSGLTVIALAWHLLTARRAAFVAAVGLASGIALLVKEVSIFLLVTPLVFGVLSRSRELVTRAALALAAGLALWAVFPAWAVSLGQFDRFLDEKLRTFERLLGVLQITGWNRPNVSFIDALLLSAPQYLTSYLLLIGGALALTWMWLRGTRTAGTYLLAWLASTYAFGAYTVTRGQLNEQFFVYLMPGAIIATVFAADALATSLRRRWAARDGGPWQRLSGRAAVAVPLAALVGLALLSGGSANRYHLTAEDHGIQQMVAFIDEHLEPCDVVNASGDVQKYVFSLEGRRVSRMASGPRAMSRGVRYFFLNPKDVWARYGRMTPDFADWIRRNGTRVAAYPSITYWSVQLWKVDPGPYEPIADLQPTEGGAFGNADGSACGGYRILDGPNGFFFTGYREVGGKSVLGRPQSAPWTAGGTTYQAFDGALLASRGEPGPASPARPSDLVERLAEVAPDLLVARHVPLPDEDPPTGDLLTDAAIAEAYLGRPAGGATAADSDRADELWGAPLGRPRQMADGFIRQPFANVVWERPADGSAPPRLALLGEVAVAAGIVPDIARQARPVPNLEERADPIFPSDVRPFLGLFGSAILGWTVVSVVAIRRSRNGDAPAAPPVSEGRPLRVLVDGRVIQDRYHGIGRATVNLVRALAEPGNLEVAVLRGSAPAQRLSVEQLADLRNVELVPFDAPVASLREQLGWPSALARVQADVLFVPYHLATPWRPPLPVVTVVHDCIFEESPAFAPGRVVRWLYRLLTRVALRNASAVVTVSDATRAAVEEHYGRHIRPDHVIRNAVDPRFRDRIPPRVVERIRQELALPPRYLLTVGVRRPHKNHATLVRAFARLERHDVDLVIVGSPDRRYDDPVPELIEELGLAERVHLVEGVSEAHLPAVYQGAAAFAFPSIVEGFGLPVVEAIASGLPVVASDVPAVAEAAAGRAVLVAPLDVEAWASALHRVLSLPAPTADARPRPDGNGAEETWAPAAARLRAVLLRVARRHG